MDPQTPAITDQWQINFAIIISIISLMISLVRWFVESRQKIRQERIRAYEEVYDDACFILGYPFEQRRLESKSKEYKNDNPELQHAVREYLNSHWMKNMWGEARLVPKNIKEEHKKYEFLHLVQEKACKFEDEMFKFRIAVDVPNKSPVYYFESQEIVSRFSNIMSYVGKHLSLFSDQIRRLWEEAKYADPTEVKTEYQKALDVCQQFFKHNHRDFADPFYDLVETIRAEYREMTRKKKILNYSIKGKLRFILWTSIHPVKAFKEAKLRR